jgi:hypothetical protein
MDLGPVKGCIPGNLLANQAPGVCKSKDEGTKDEFSLLGGCMSR